MGADFFNQLEDMLWKAYRDARKGKRHTSDQQRFELNAAENIHNLAVSIQERTYKPSRGIAFITKKPVVREIFAAPFRDRVVHHFLYNVCNPWWERHLIYDSYSCRKGKGTHFGGRRLQHHMQSVSNNYTEEAWVIKLDIKAFFMSMIRARVLERILWGLDRQFGENKNELYRTCRYLWTEIIMDDPVQGVIKRGPLSNWNLLPPEKSLFNQARGVGIVIGNLTSQLASNIFLDQLDRFVKGTLGYKHYGRYVDDFYMVVPVAELEKAKRDIRSIRQFLRAMGLTLHKDKIYFQEVRKGVDFVGARIYPRQITPGKRLRKNYRIMAYDFAAGYGTTEQLIAYFGMMKNYASRKYEREVYEELGWDWK